MVSKRRTGYSYIRFSSPEQLRGDSLRRQIADRDAYCVREGVVLDDSLKMTDLGVSAFRGKHRQEGGLARFLQAIEDGLVLPGSVLIVESMDRFSREEIDTAYRTWTDILRKGVDIVTLKPSERLYTRESCNDMVSIITTIAEMSRAHEESSLKSVRIIAAWHKRRAQRTMVCPSWLKGRADGSGFDVITEKAEVVRRIFRLTAQGWSTYRITRMLNAESVPGLGRRKDSGLWHQGVVTRLLASRTVLGEFQPMTGWGVARVPDGPPIVGFYPDIITEGEWYAARAGRTGRRLERGPVGKGIANLFHGLLYDARDGSRLTVINHLKGKPRARYMCSAAALRGEPGKEYRLVRLDRMEAAFLALVRELRPQEIIGKNHRDDGVALAQSRLGEIVERIKTVKQQAAHRDACNVSAIVDLLVELEQERQVREVALEKAREAAHADPHGRQVEKAMTVLEMLTMAPEGDEKIALRLKAKAAIKRIVERVDVLIEGPRLRRHATMQVKFQDGTVRLVQINHLGEARTHKKPFPLSEGGKLGLGGEALVEMQAAKWRKPQG